MMKRRRRDVHAVGGVAKVLWILFVIVLPYLGVFAYLIARGDDMAARDLERAQTNEAALRGYVRDVAGSGTSAADELERLAALRDAGTIDDAEFSRLKANVVG